MYCQLLNAEIQSIRSVIANFKYLDIFTLSQRYIVQSPKKRVNITLVSCITRTELIAFIKMFGSIKTAPASL